MTSGQTWADQLVFRWDADNRSGNTGFGLVAWSNDPERAEKVFRGVARKLQVSGDEVAPGLVRIVDRTGESVLLVRRVLGHDPGGRPGTVCHALLGSNASLGVETCIGLHRWSWEGSDLPLNEVRGRLDPVPAKALLQASMPQCEDLSRFLPQVAEELSAATAEVLRHPGSRYTFLDRTGGEFPFLILWGLRGILGELRATHPLGWSFASHDTDDSEKFRFVFVPRWPASAAHDERRVRTDLQQPRDDRALMLATELVNHHLEWSGRGGEGLRRVPATLAEAAGELGRLESGDALLAAAERAVKHLGPAVRPPGPGPRYRRDDDLDVPSIWRGETAPVPDSGPAAPPPDFRRASREEELLYALRDDLPYEEITHVLDEIRHGFDDWPSALREELARIALEKNLFRDRHPDPGGQPHAARRTPDPARLDRSAPERDARARRPAVDHGPVTRTVMPDARRASPGPEGGQRTSMITVAAGVGIIVVLLLTIVMLW
ncbi:hypothetical protein [Streptomyces winkii]|uniref:hypothetical protein n=1 Tax=Streptomyces winkii TaxID=3051178 RepID=UPI0028D54A50|nr:hypothetical protein [Streptomyces sp. DSM 40971]